MRILPDWLQELGAVAGLAVAAFTIFDRFARGRPRLSVFVSDDQRSIRVSNDAAHDIAVLNWSVYPPVYAVAEIESHQAATRSAAGRSFRLMMKPKSEREFPLIMHYQKDKPLDRAHRRALIVLHWRKGTSLWLPQFPAWTIVQTNLVRSIRTRGYDLGELEPTD
jgi:hypothetical protein